MATARGMSRSFRAAALEQQTGPIGILVDLAGPKIRLGTIAADPLVCQRGNELRFVRGQTSQIEDHLVSNYERLIDELQIDDDVLLADGSVRLVVIAKESDQVVCRVANAGQIRSRQGINLPGARISLPSLTDHDQQCVRWAATQAVDYLSLSFVRRPEDLDDLRRLLAAQGSQIPIVAKIEKREAIEQLDAIIQNADAVMVARGDLGVEIDVAEVPVAQKEIIAKCNAWQKPVIVATQMLDSMQHSPRPTRAETSDVANAILDGADACMLSGESAVGKYPVETVRTMNRIMTRTEPLLRGRPIRPPAEVSTTGAHPVTRAIVHAAGIIAAQVDAKLTVIATRSGATALTKSNLRHFVPAIAVSNDPNVLRRHALLGDHPAGGGSV